jgi:Secretion system C-terminal sorting domain
MDFGITATNSNFNISTTSFSNIPYRAVGWFDVRGWGITLNNGSLNLTGFGVDGASAFDNTYVGIYLNSARYDIQNCNFNNCSIGAMVYWSQLNSNSNIISNNKFRVSEGALQLGYNGNNVIMVENNDIAPTANSLNQGFSINEFSSSNPYYYIYNNTIRLNSVGTNFGGTASGISLNNVGQNASPNTINVYMGNNKIFLENRSTQIVATGIQSFYSGGIDIQYNFINGSGLNSTTGINVTNSYVYNRIECNGMDNMKYGMVLSGNNLLDQKIKLNRFLHVSETGLLLSSDAVIGQQFNTGNVWEFDGYNDFAAKHLGSNRAASQITTNSATNLFARNNISPSTGWFFPTTATPNDWCGSYFQSPVLQVRGGEPTEEEIVNNNNSSFRTVAEGKNTHQSEATQNIANRQLMRFLALKSQDTRFALNNNFAIFNNKVKSKIEARQFAWDKSLEAALAIDTAVVTKLKENAKLQQVLIKKATADIQQQIEMEKRDKVAAAKARPTDNTLSDLMKVRKDMEVEHGKKIEKVKVKLRTDNKNNQGQKVFEQHETYVNDAFLDITEGKKLNQGQIEQLDIIANLCPSIGGVAVYKARSVLSNLAAYIGTRSWRDLQNCSEDALTIRGNEANNAVEVNTPKVLAFPNPSNDILRLSFYDANSVSENPHTIQIFNTTGAVVKQIELEMLQDTDIDTKGMSEGIYILKVSAKDGQWSKTLKISILH